MTDTIERVECLSLHMMMSALLNNVITPLLAFLNLVTVGRTHKLKALAVSAYTIDWLAPVSGIQFTSKPLVHAPGGPSYRDISGVGLLEGV